MIYIPFIYFVLLVLFLWKKHKSFEISAYIASIYAISAFFSILIDWMNLYGFEGVCENAPLNFLPTLIYCVLITIAIIPFSLFNSQAVIRVNLIEKRKLFNFLSYFFIFIFVYSLIYFWLDFSRLMQSSLKEIRGVVYDTTAESQDLVGIQYIMALPTTLFSQYSPIVMLFFFYSVAYLNKSLAFNYTLLAASLTPVLQASLIAGRTQIVYWLMTFIFLYIIFKKHIPIHKRTRIFIPFIIICALIFIFFIAVTFSRWDYNNSSVNSGMIIYAGQSYINFCYFFDNYTLQQLTFDRIFPFTSHFIFHSDYNLNDYRYFIWSKTGFNIGIFYTFLGDLLIDLGHIGMIIYVFIYATIAVYLLRRKNNNNVTFHKLLLLIVFALIPLQGIFYYSYHKIDVSYYIIGTFVIYFLFKYKKIQW